MQKGKHAEPETLRVHREMYERRLREMEASGTSSGREVDAANGQEVIEHRDDDEDEKMSKKAALVA